MSATFNTTLGPLMIDVESTALTQSEREILQHPLVGGIILFSRNYVSKPQLQHLINEIRDVRAELLITVDQEGGRVQRLRDGFTKLPPLAEFGALYGKNPLQAKQFAYDSALQMATEVLAQGIDFSFAPVLDVDQGRSTIIGDRSFNQNPQVVSDLATAYISGMNQAGMAATGKHFPGHGFVAADSHHELPRDERDYDTIWQQDLLPYRQLHNKLGAMMTAHIVYPEIDPKPASFSSFWLQTVLRERIGFAGAIISDDLNMQGAAIAAPDYVGRTEAALAAGCDMVLLCNNRAATLTVLDHFRYQMPEKSLQRLQVMRSALFEKG